VKSKSPSAARIVDIAPATATIASDKTHRLKLPRRFARAEIICSAEFFRAGIFIKLLETAPVFCFKLPTSSGLRPLVKAPNRGFAQNSFTDAGGRLNEPRRNNKTAFAQRPNR
jgi:hypothetical protein